MSSSAKNCARLGVNLDHVATLRQARRDGFPNPIECIDLLVEHGAHQVTIHLREDRRHMNDADLIAFSNQKKLPLNLEMAAVEEMKRLAKQYNPTTCTLVPEKREEVTTEGGLNVLDDQSRLKIFTSELKDSGIFVSYFVDPDLDQIKAAANCGANAIELHTGTYAQKFLINKHLGEIERVQNAVSLAKSLGLKIYAGHGLDVKNLALLVSIRDIEEYNIGFSIIARSIFVGLGQAIAEIQAVLKS